MFSTQRPNHPHSEAILPTSRVPSWSRLPVRPTLAALSVNLQQPVEHPQLSTITASPPDFRDRGEFAVLERVIQTRNDRPRPPGPPADHRMDRPALSQQTTPPRSAAKETSHQTAPASPRHGTRAARARGTSATNGRGPAQATQATAGCQAQAEQPLRTHRNPAHADRRWRGSTVARLSTPRRTRCPQRRQGCVPYRLTWDTGGCREREFAHG